VELLFRLVDLLAADRPNHQLRTLWNAQAKRGQSYALDPAWWNFFASHGLWYFYTSVTYKERDDRIVPRYTGGWVFLTDQMRRHATNDPYGFQKQHGAIDVPNAALYAWHLFVTYLSLDTTMLFRRLNIDLTRFADLLEFMTYLRGGVHEDLRGHDVSVRSQQEKLRSLWLKIQDTVFDFGKPSHTKSRRRKLFPINEKSHWKCPNV
jgi:hypothetical protein